MKRAFQRTLTCLLALVLLVTAMPSGILALAAGEQAVQITNLPTLYITLDNGAQQGEITKDGPQLPGVVSMAAEGYDPIVDAPITIKGRGNSTWTLPKKPYQIKFTEKTDLLGMGAAKKWILLANYWDKTLVRNYITYNLAAKMGMAYTTECKFVDVVINGVYQGNYLLTEKIELGKERIDEDELLGGTLFELEMQYRHAEEGCPACVITNDGVHTIVKDPEPATQDELASLKADSLSFLNDMEDKLKQGYQVYSQYIDVPSFIDWYILNEVAKNYDAAFVTSTYCYRSTDNILHMGPVWDVDVCFGNQDVTYPDTVDNGLYPYNYRADKGAWYRTLFEDQTFVDMLKARWNQLNDEGYWDGMLAQINETADYLAESQAKEQAAWPDAMQVTHVRGKGTPYFTYDEEIAYLKQYITQRIDWLNTHWGPDEQYSNRLYDNTLIDRITADELIYSIGEVDSSGYLSWNYQPEVFPNSPLSSFWGYSYDLEEGDYYFELTYTVKDPVYTDYLMLACDAEYNYSTFTYAQTPATHVSYATCNKDRGGVATLRLPFSVDASNDYTYTSRVDAYNAAAVQIRELSLYKVGNARSKVYEIGDVDTNDTISATDALLVLQHTVELTTLSPMQRELGDVDRKDGVNTNDALFILQYTVNLISNFDF